MKLNKLPCQGSECLNEVNTNGFFHPGEVPWIGYPTNIETPQTEKFVTYCYSSNSNAKLQLMSIDDDDYVLEPNVVSTRGNIKEAKFIARNDHGNNAFLCIDINSNKESPNLAEIVTSSKHYSEWSAWSTCNRVGKDNVFRSRTINQDLIDSETRSCRCSDLAIPPSPR